VSSGKNCLCGKGFAIESTRPVAALDESLVVGAGWPSGLSLVNGFSEESLCSVLANVALGKQADCGSTARRPQCLEPSLVICESVGKADERESRQQIKFARRGEYGKRQNIVKKYK
jgi:hypothetical protein